MKTCARCCYLNVAELGYTPSLEPLEKLALQYHSLSITQLQNKQVKAGIVLNCQGLGLSRKPRSAGYRSIYLFIGCDDFMLCCHGYLPRV